MILIYDGSYEGFLSTVFDAYALRVADGALIRPEGRDCVLPLEEWRDAARSAEKAERVTKKLHALGLAETVFDAWLSRDSEIENNLLGVIALAIREGNSPMERLYLDSVRAVAGAARRVRTEAHRFLQFVRFVKVESKRPALTDGGEAPGLYVADIEPEYDILPKIAGHFARRFQDQRFIIRDKVRNQALVYDTKACQIVTFPEIMAPPLPNDAQFERLWRRYFDSVAIPWRKNLKLQQHFVPKKYRKHLTEFQNRQR